MLAWMGLGPTAGGWGQPSWSKVCKDEIPPNEPPNSFAKLGKQSRKYAQCGNGPQPCGQRQEEVEEEIEAEEGEEGEAAPKPAAPLDTLAVYPLRRAIPLNYWKHFAGRGDWRDPEEYKHLRFSFAAPWGPLSHFRPPPAWSSRPGPEPPSPTNAPCRRWSRCL